MKNKLSSVYIPFVFVAMCLMFTACEEELPTDRQNENIDTWSLVKYQQSAFFPDQFQAFDKDQIVWAFDADNQSLEVKIEEVDKIENLPGPGTYQYELKEHACNYGDNQYINIEGRGYGVMITDNIANDSLMITNECVDGHVILFVRS